jgi:hypothetical protein
VRQTVSLQPSTAIATAADAEFRHRLARISGLLYLTIAVLGMFAPTLLETFAVPGDPAGTAANLRDSAGLFGLSLVGWVVLLAADATLAVTLYLILKPVGRALSLGMAAFRLAYVASVAASQCWPGPTVTCGSGKSRCCPRSIVSAPTFSSACCSLEFTSFCSGCFSTARGTCHAV